MWWQRCKATTYSTAGAFNAAVDINGTTNTLSLNGQNVTVNLNGATAGAKRQQFIDAVNSQVSGVTASAGAARRFNADGGRRAQHLGCGQRHCARPAPAARSLASPPRSAGERGSARQRQVAVVRHDHDRPGLRRQAGGSSAAKARQRPRSTTLISLDISTTSGSSTALLIADAILDKISAGRGDLGALQNRLTSTVANLGVVSDKVSEARSRILDADFAQETAALTKGQILQQAGIAILAQANSAPQQVLSLLPR